MDAPDITMTLSEENVQVLHLVQALIGAVSRNFRRVTLEVLKPSAVHLIFVLEHEDTEDREEIEDIAFEFEALQGSGIELSVEVIVDRSPIADLGIPGRVVFGRKEDE